MQIKSFQDENLKNKIVLLRTDYNVPTNDKVVVDTTRIDESIPTINALLKMGAKIIIITHRGRPKGQIDISLSMEPIARELEKKINRPPFVHFCISLHGLPSQNKTFSS